MLIYGEKAAITPEGFLKAQPVTRITVTRDRRHTPDRTTPGNVGLAFQIHLDPSNKVAALSVHTSKRKEWRIDYF